MNNQMFRNLAAQPQYFLDCKNHFGEDELTFVGDAYGNEAQTEWVVVKKKISVGGGPYQWFHRYNRCPASNECAAIDAFLERAEPDTPEGCCDNLEPGMRCQPDCQTWIRNDETAIAADAGFYYHFESDPVTGEPFGCPGFEETTWANGKSKYAVPNCDKETYAPDGEPLYTIVDDYAENNQKFMDDFFPTLTKMSSNGYDDSQLIVNEVNILDF